MKILRKKNCGFTIIEILVVVSIMAMLIGIAGKRLMPRNPLVDDDVLKIRDFIEKCVFECRTRSLSHFDKFKRKDKSGENVEFFTSGVINASRCRSDDAKLYGKPSGGGTYPIRCMTYKQRSDSGFDNKLHFGFPKLRKRITDIEDGVFIINKTPKFRKYDQKEAERDIIAGGFLIWEKGSRFLPDHWSTFFDGFFAILDRPCFDKDDDEGILCWKVTLDYSEEWCFYVDDLCICHSVRVQ